MNNLIKKRSLSMLSSFPGGNPGDYNAVNALLKP